VRVTEVFYYLPLQSNTATYDGQYLVRDHDDALVVSFNYRTNIFGQPSAPQLSGANTTKAQNFALLDVAAAVQWVHDNIAAFGGDPERIILFGESAGAATTDMYSYMRPNDTIVKGRSHRWFYDLMEADLWLAGIIQLSGKYV